MDFINRVQNARLDDRRCIDRNGLKNALADNYF